MSGKVIDNSLYAGMSLKSLLETTDIFQIPGLKMDESGGVKDGAFKKKDGSDLYNPNAAFLGPDLWDNTQKMSFKSVKNGAIKKKDGSDSHKPNAAFLGPDLWDNTQKMSLEYLDLDEFLTENNIPLELCMSPEKSGQQQQQHEPSSSTPPASPTRITGMLVGGADSPLSDVSFGSPENESNHIIIRGDSPMQFVNPAIVEQREISPDRHIFIRDMSPNPDSFPAATSTVPSVRTENNNFVIKVSAKPTVPSSCGPRIWTPRKVVDVDFKIDDADLALATVPGLDFDPRNRAFSADELKPQPMIKKSRKQYVPEDLKDEHYWQRRNKNNYAAKRSREARRLKENQIAMRANFLEKENSTLTLELATCKTELSLLKKRLAMYENTT